MNVLEATVRLVPSPSTGACSCSAIPTCSRRQTTCRPWFRRTRSASRIRRPVDQEHDRQAPLAAERAVLPDGRAWLYAEFGHDDADEATALAESAPEAVKDGRSSRPG